MMVFEGFERLGRVRLPWVKTRSRAQARQGLHALLLAFLPHGCVLISPCLTTAYHHTTHTPQAREAAPSSPEIMVSAIVSVAVQATLPSLLFLLTPRCMCMPSSLCATSPHAHTPSLHTALYPTQSSALTRAFRRVAAVPRNVRRFGSSHGDHGGKFAPQRRRKEGEEGIELNLHVHITETVALSSSGKRMRRET